jgi:transposase
MSMSKREGEKQPSLWIPTTDLARSPGHPFYERLNKVLAAAGFDPFVEQLCAPFYAQKNGRPSIAPGIYVRMLLVGYFEGLRSEREIDWRCADSLSLRGFLGYDLSQKTPDHSSLCRIRQRLDLETHKEVFTFVLRVLAEAGLLQGKTLGIDATTMEANAAMKSIVRRDGGESYDAFLESLAKESGIETPTRADLARIDKKRKNKASNDDWQNPNDPEAEITKLKDGRTHLAHKVEHAVDMDSGAVLAVTIQPGARGDTQSLPETLNVAIENTLALLQDPRSAQQLSGKALSELVTDKGYHSNDTMTLTAATGCRTYISEPDRGRRDWEGKEYAQQATYANRRRIKGDRGKALMKRRGEILERTFAHTMESGAMRRAFLRLRDNILKRYLVHVAAFNLSLVMRTIFGVGTPRELRGRLQLTLEALAAALGRLMDDAYRLLADISRLHVRHQQSIPAGRDWAFSTGC